MNILIVEDEKLAVDKLVQTLSKVRPEAIVTGVTHSIASTVQWLTLNAMPDLVLMDIELADGQSFAIFEQVDIRCPVIFVTSYDEYALKAFKVASIDYLLKPIQQEELRLAFDKLDTMRTWLEAAPKYYPDVNSLVKALQQFTPAREYRQRFLVKYLQKLVSIEVSSIAFFYFEDRVIFFKTLDNKKYLLDYSLDELESMLDPAVFFRISRWLIVSIKSIKQIEPYAGNRLLLQLTPDYDKEAVVSREKVNNLKAWMGR